jgi:hypothetical protein
LPLVGKFGNKLENGLKSTPSFSSYREAMITRLDGRKIVPNDLTKLYASTSPYTERTRGTDTAREAFYNLLPSVFIVLENCPVDLLTHLGGKLGHQALRFGGDEIDRASRAYSSFPPAYSRENERSNVRPTHKIIYIQVFKNKNN